MRHMLILVSKTVHLRISTHVSMEHIEERVQDGTPRVLLYKYQYFS